VLIIIAILLQIASPACTELEVVMLDWLGKMLELPKEFLASAGGKGGGVIQVNSDLHIYQYILVIDVNRYGNPYRFRNILFV
jgi:hypothetical protein